MRKELEGGCGVIGTACAEKMAGKHLLPALRQMRNRGNGKGGGIAAAGLSHNAFGITQHILENDYLLAIAYLDDSVRSSVEHTFIHPIFEIDHVHQMPHMAENSLTDLEVTPPNVVVYFVRIKEDVFHACREQYQLSMLPRTAIEDEIVYQNSYQLNKQYYATVGDKKAFVLSQGKDLIVLKLVGFGDDAIRYYKLEDFQAHVWIGHHRYPTKGRVWHPGGAHPFVGLNEALVHNGDFANYYSMCEYLAQRNIHTLFQTDTEVAALLFDLLHRTYGYPLEYVIEALAPTTERDFSLLPPEKQQVYRLLQKVHLHASPDGPWFFLIAQSVAHQKQRLYRLLGITDTSMLRPQVFALQQGAIPIGLAASEKQAIDATLESLAKENSNFWGCADYYWNARGGSHTDGGAFGFTVHPGGHLVCEDKFGQPMHTASLKAPQGKSAGVSQECPTMPPLELFSWATMKARTWSYAQASGFLTNLAAHANPHVALEVMTLLLDQQYPLEHMRRSSFVAILNNAITDLFQKRFPCINFRGQRPTHGTAEQFIVIDAQEFPPEGDQSLARTIVELYQAGFRTFAVFNCRGHRFIANGLGANSTGVKIDVYGSSGDYLASGINGAAIHVHGSGQDQLGQIMKSGTLVVHGDIGQTFMYGAKGGQAFIRGNAAGRPMINAVGKPRVVINGTCLDYLAESFMAGNALSGGGFVIVNGFRFDENGNPVELETPYPGNNLFSLASGGAIYLRDPRQTVVEEQLNGGKFVEMTDNDWEVILPYLEENAAHFEIPVFTLLEVDGELLHFNKVYRKVVPKLVRALQEEEAWVKGL